MLCQSEFSDHEIGNADTLHVYLTYDEYAWLLEHRRQAKE